MPSPRRVLAVASLPPAIPRTGCRGWLSATSWGRTSSAAERWSPRPSSSDVVPVSWPPPSRH